MTFALTDDDLARLAWTGPDETVMGCQCPPCGLVYRVKRPDEMPDRYRTGTALLGTVRPAWGGRWQAHAFRLRGARQPGRYRAFTAGSGSPLACGGQIRERFSIRYRALSGVTSEGAIPDAR